MLGHFLLALGALAFLRRSCFAVIALVVDGHLGGLAVTHRACAALCHVFVAMVAVIDHGGLDLHLWHFAHLALARLHVSHVAVVTNINRFGFRRHCFCMAFLGESSGKSQKHDQEETDSFCS